MLQSFVKSFTWSSSGDANMPVHLYVERIESNGNDFELLSTHEHCDKSLNLFDLF